MVGRTHGAWPDSVLRRWDERSSVRTKPRRLVGELLDGKALFPADQATFVRHNLLRGRPDLVGPSLTRCLYRYLDFTTALEQEIVNPVLLDLARGRAGVPLPPAMRVDAHRIYVDEAYHALVAVDLADQVSAVTGVPYEPAGRHRFHDALARRAEAAGPGRRPLVALCAAVVSETLISATLTRIPGDPSVATVVRAVVADHAQDERAHHAFFARVHEQVWPRLPAGDRAWLAPAFAEFIRAFLAPDPAAERAILESCGVRPGVAERIVAESHERVDPLPAVRSAARATLALLDRTGVLDEPGAHDAYAGLVAG